VVIGSGFGGSVAALRLRQKGYRVRVIEAGRRFADADLPTSANDPRRYLWAPAIGLRGPQRVDFLKHATVLSGVGVGGGSLVYGNTLYTPGESFFGSPEIERLGGRAGLEPFYDVARRMMGVVPNELITPTDELARQVAADMGREHTFAPSPVGVYFGEPGVRVPDPYFDGEGPDRVGCTGCGACNLGCPVGAKNTLVRTYLGLAERLGAEVWAESRVTRVIPRSSDGGDGYVIEVRRGRRSERFQTAGVVVSAGVLGSLRLLMESRRKGDLNVSEALGHGVRTNSETVLAVRDRDRRADRGFGIAASTSFWVDDSTQVQFDRQAPGSDSTAGLFTLLPDGGGRIPRVFRWLAALARSPRDVLRHLDPRGFARQTVILVVMQDHGGGLILERRRRWWAPWTFALRSRPGPEGASPTWIPEGNDVARRLAKKMNGIPLAWVTEALLDRPVTAHILGGCPLAEGPSSGVVNGENRVFGYRNLLICDGSVVPRNLGVNPALTILALTERAMSSVPVRPGSTFRPLAVDTRWGTTDLLLGSSP
jgi:cholesterol oxidase